MTPLEILHDAIANRLSEMETLFKDPDDYRLTFIARSIKNPRAHVIVSSEDTETRFGDVRRGLAELEANGLDVENLNVARTAP